MGDESYTLLAVRPDGSVPVVDLVVGGRGQVLSHARAFLAEHRSCDRVEIWLDGRLVDEIGRAATPGQPAAFTAESERLLSGQAD